MTDAETAARGHRAEQCDEFLRPILDEMRDTYLARITEIAATELNARKRTEAITALSAALRIHRNVETGLKAAIDAGKIAGVKLLRAEEIERMGRDKRHIFDIVPRR